MGVNPHADRNRPASGSPRSQSGPPPRHDEMPTTFMRIPDLRPTVADRPAAQVLAAPVPPRRLSLRQRLVGQRSIIFIAIMLARMVWLLVQGIRTGQDLRFAAAGAGIYVMALFIASPARRFRSISVGIMCGLIWSYAFVDPSQLGSPAISAWPAVFPIGVLAVLVEIIFTDIIRAHRGKFGGQAGRLAASLPRPAVLLQVFALALFVIPIIVMCIEGTLAYGFGSEPLQDLVLVSISLPPLIGMFVYVSFVLRRLRGLAPRTVKA